MNKRLKEVVIFAAFFLAGIFFGYLINFIIDDPVLKTDLRTLKEIGIVEEVILISQAEVISFSDKEVRFAVREEEVTAFLSEEIEKDLVEGKIYNVNLEFDFESDKFIVKKIIEL